MSLQALFVSMRARRRRSAQQSYEEGAQITRRLQELLAVPMPVRVETPTLAMETPQHVNKADKTEALAAVQGR